MKSIQTKSINLAIAAILLTVPMTGSAVAGEKLVPFKGSLSATEPFVVENGFLIVSGTGGGIATHLGSFTLTWAFRVNTADGTGSGTVRFTAANGDTLTTSGTGTSGPTDVPGVFHINELQTITGGTGRFAGATGHLTVERLTDLNTGFTSGSFQGVISSVASSK